MKKVKVMGIFLVVALFMGFTAGSFQVLAAEKTAEQKADRKAMEKGMQDSLGVPVLTGDLWQKMTHDSKVAFIWGFGQVVTIEQHLMDKYPELKRDSFVAKVVEGMADIPMNEVVARVDQYFIANPDQIKEPVTVAIWDTMIKPNIKTGIAGRPLMKSAVKAAQ
jgi:hypothetical protein